MCPAAGRRRRRSRSAVTSCLPRSGLPARRARLRRASGRHGRARSRGRTGRRDHVPQRVPSQRRRAQVCLDHAAGRYGSLTGAVRDHAATVEHDYALRPSRVPNRTACRVRRAPASDRALSVFAAPRSIAPSPPFADLPRARPVAADAGAARARARLRATAAARAGAPPRANRRTIAKRDDLERLTRFALHALFLAPLPRRPQHALDEAAADPDVSSDGRVVEHVELFEWARRLDDGRQAMPARRCGGQRVTSRPPPEPRRRPPDGTPNATEKSRLAGAVRSDQARQRARRDRERNVVDGPHRAERLAHPPTSSHA